VISVGSDTEVIMRNEAKTIVSCTISLHPISAEKMKLFLKKISNYVFGFFS